MNFLQIQTTDNVVTKSQLKQLKGGNSDSNATVSVIIDSDIDTM